MASYLNRLKRSSGLDFSDRGQSFSLDQHPDLKGNYTEGTLKANHLQRNKTERRRLQPLQRTNGVVSAPKGPHKPKKFMDKWSVWMINEGGRRLFFFVWIFLHLLVFALGFVNYRLSDNMVNARAMFGYGYGA